MTDHPKCATCAHWEADEDGFSRSPTYPGHCKFIPHGEDCAEWDESGPKLCNVLKPEYRDRLAFVHDGSGYHASLSPSPDFYCAHHSALRGDDNE